MNGRFKGRTLSNTETNAIVRNLKDAGCNACTISDFMGELKEGKTAEGLKLLAVHRRSLLDHLHEEQKRIDRLDFDNVTLKGKYSFQYIQDSVFENCNFDTKDAFWHAKNVTVRNSTVKGEYLAWYCENVTFENCRNWDAASLLL